MRSKLGRNSDANDTSINTNAPVDAIFSKHFGTEITIMARCVSGKLKELEEDLKCFDQFSEIDPIQLHLLTLCLSECLSELTHQIIKSINNIKYVKDIIDDIIKNQTSQHTRIIAKL
jgi:hypothetical protein